MLTKMNPIQRILSAAAGLLLIDPGTITDVVGLCIIVAVIVWQIFDRKLDNKPKLVA